VRKVNEDAVLALPEQKIWVISDGMGGHAAGDFASQTVVDEIAMILPGLAPQELMDALRAAVSRAHETILAKAAETGGGTIGATVVTLVLANGHFAGFWAGDSRLYLLRGGEISMLTRDHSFVAALEDGQMTWDQAEHHPRSNEITRAVGVGEAVELEKIRGEVMPGDRFLLCSDGLTKYASFEVLRRAIDGAPIETVSDSLMQLALDGGGADNVSVIVVDIL
jgi:protein phosphatase/serine/threonine-protein phosphatase Stp1